MNLNDIIDIHNSDFVHEFLNNKTRVRKEIEEKLTPLVADTPWMADYAASYFSSQSLFGYIFILFDFFDPSSNHITETDVRQRLRRGREEFLKNVTDSYHMERFPTPLVPYTEPEWEKFYTKIWVEVPHLDDIVEIIKRNENQLALQLWEWLKANYPDYVKID
ncbi:hypothetical protein ABX041_003766 [Salmonella enterica]|nr:hypothetical protein [Salmonella enterica subsp. enterica serovar Bovismorbificans]EIM4514651.1 hypothetical protein [Salmonella enterica subsp. enterica serovar Bovismorbificans]